jgi:biopolymer transport protein ExbB
MDNWQSLLALFEKGGLVMPLLLLGSVMTVAVAVERYRVFRRADADTADLQEKLQPLLLGGEWRAALALVQDNETLSAYVAAAGLSQAERGGRAVELAMEGAASRGAARLRQRLDILSLVVTLAPLLGLLGTVIGMIRAFNVLTIRSGQPSAITGGVGEALVATAAGLCVAILALTLLAYFRNRLDAVLNETEELAALVLAAVTDRET